MTDTDLARALAEHLEGWATGIVPERVYTPEEAEGFEPPRDFEFPPHFECAAPITAPLHHPPPPYESRGVSAPVRGSENVTDRHHAAPRAYRGAYHALCDFLGRALARSGLRGW